MIYELTIEGRIPSKKNSKFWTGKKLIPSKQYREWQQINSWKLNGKGKAPNPCGVIMTFFLPDKRKTDLTNKAESIMDLLVDVGILEDDNYKIVPSLFLHFGCIDKENPRVEIVFNKLV